MSDWFYFALRQEARFWSHVRREAGCWEWQSGVDKDGYGKFSVSLPRANGKQQQKHVRAHRLALLLTGRDVPAGALVLHECDNPRCCNPAHLTVGTQRRNRRDAAARGRTARGERHPQAKVTAEDVVEIRRRALLGVPTKLIASRFGLSKVQVRHIVTRRNWRHVG